MARYGVCPCCGETINISKIRPVSREKSTDFLVTDEQEQLTIDSLLKEKSIEFGERKRGEKFGERKH